MGVIILNTIISGLILGGIYALIALGLNFQYGVAKILNLSHGAFIMIFCFFVYILYGASFASPPVLIILSGPLGFIFSLALYKILFQKLQYRSGSIDKLASSTLLASFGVAFMIENYALMLWGSDIFKYSYLSTPVKILTVSLPLNRLVSFSIAILLSVAVYLFLRWTLFGRAIRAASADVIGAQVVGINVGRIQMLSFALGGGLAAISGSLLSMMFSFDALVGTSYTIIALIVIIIGGTGNFLGAMSAGLLLGVIESLGGYIFGPGLRLFVIFALLLIILFVRPQGIFGGGR